MAGVVLRFGCLCENFHPHRSTTPAPHPARRVTPQNRWSQRSHKDFAETLRRPRLAATVETWWPAIEAAIITNYSNARSEGYNRLAKHEGRNAFGFRNPDNYRLCSWSPAGYSSHRNSDEPL